MPAPQKETHRRSTRFTSHTTIGTTPMADNDNRPADLGAGKYGQARALADKAMRLEAEGDQEAADRLFDEAQRIDPDAVAAALDEAVTSRPAHVEGPASDAEIAAMSRTIEPHADAPDRANITGSGSGADAEK